MLINIYEQNNKSNFCFINSKIINFSVKKHLYHSVCNIRDFDINAELYKHFCYKNNGYLDGIYEFK